MVVVSDVRSLPGMPCLMIYENKLMKARFSRAFFVNMEKYKIKTTIRTKVNDLLTPVAAYLLLRDRFASALLLESADYHDRSDSKSYICLEPIAGFESDSEYCNILLPGRQPIRSKLSNPKEVLDKFRIFYEFFIDTQEVGKERVAGLFGYTAFDSVQAFEDIRFNKSSSELKSIPLMKYALYRYVLVFDHFKSELTLAANSTHGAEIFDLDLIEELLQVGIGATFDFQTEGEETSSIADSQFEEYVEKGIRHCHRGDVFQIVLSREFKQRFSGDEFQVYRALRSINPSPYLFYFDYGEFKIFGSSPEAQIQVSNGTASIHPIAGTLGRGEDKQDDISRAELLRKDPKEMSEHVMLVDLARNDLGKYTDDVHVSTFAEIQYFSHVIHMVSKVEGKKRPHNSIVDIYAHTFPAGTLSGAPKYRAMQLIDEIEDVVRSYYGGAIGFFGFDGTVNHAILIRSFLSKNGYLVYQAGAGVVAGSKPKNELEEVNKKVSALRKAILKAEEL